MSPEMTPSGKKYLRNWGGTYELKRDGRGCGVDGDLAGGEPITVISLASDMKRLMIARARVAETTRHPHLPHCESSDLRDFEILAGALGLEAKIF